MKFSILTLLIVSSAWGAPNPPPRISIHFFKGDKDNRLRRQVELRVCAAFQCIDSDQATGSNDWRLGGEVKSRGRVLLLHLASATATANPPFEQALPTPSGKLTNVSLFKFKQRMTRYLKSVPGVPTKIQPPEAAEVSPAPAPSEAAQTEPEAAQPIAVEPRAPPRPVKTPLLIAELGIDIISRRFQYIEQTQGSLLNYQASFIFSPRVHLEGYPFSDLFFDFPRNLGLSLDYLSALGLHSQLGSSVKYPTQLHRFELALKLRVQPILGKRLLVIPELGYHQSSFSVNSAQDGSVLSGLPSLTYQALDLAVAAEWQLGGTVGEVAGSEEPWVPFVRVVFLPVLSAHDLVGPNYFNRGSAVAFHAEAGMRIPLAPRFSLIPAVEWSFHSLQFSPLPGDAYLAKGATDSYLGGRLMGRFTW